MIRQIKIQNFALAKDIEINFENGFNVLIGETGAGKSIILKSIYYLLGEKFNKVDIRTGESFVKVVGLFDANSKTNEVLKKFGLNPCNELLISRFNDNFRGESRVNGEIVSLAMLGEIAQTLVDYYGQHENVRLLKVANHINYLDSFKPENVSQYKKNLSILMEKYRNLKSQIDEIGGSFENRERLLDLLDYQIKEIEAVNPKPEEDTEIENKLFAFRNSEKVYEAIENSLEKLDGINGVLVNLKETSKSLQNLTKFDSDADKMVEKLDNFFFEIKDIAETLDNKLNNNSFSEYELEKLDDRNDKIKSLKKKYGGDIESVLQFLNKAKNDKNALINAESKLQKLNSELEQIESELQQVSQKLSNARKVMAREFEAKIMQEFTELGMKNAKLKVDFLVSTDFSNNGTDKVEFLFSANLGQELKPLSKTISGGEMSRFMLALKNITSENGIPSLIFDEIDAGISGEIGSAIAQKIAKLSKNEQVICITHLPQVCAMADSYYYVSKGVDNGATASKIENITGQKILECIAKLSGGKFDTEISLAHAKELKTWANSVKQRI